MRHRTEVSRLEGFSDAAFGFAVTLLVSSQQVPAHFDELQIVMRNALAFAISFGIICVLWYRHYLFFRRYDLEDTYTVVLNCVLLFVILFSVYPVKFTIVWLTDVFAGAAGSTHNADGTIDYVSIRHGQIPLLIQYYLLALGTIGVAFGLLYLHAFRHRHRLRLNELETFEAFSSTVNCALLSATAYGSAVWFHSVLTTHRVMAKTSAAIYLIVLAVASVAYRITMRRYHNRLDNRLSAEALQETESYGGSSR